MMFVWTLSSTCAYKTGDINQFIREAAAWLYELHCMMIQSWAFVVIAGIEVKPATVVLWFWMYDVVSVLVKTQ